MEISFWLRPLLSQPARWEGDRGGGWVGLRGPASVLANVKIIKDNVSSPATTAPPPARRSHSELTINFVFLISGQITLPGMPGYWSELIQHRDQRERESLARKSISIYYLFIVWIQQIKRVYFHAIPSHVVKREWWCNRHTNRRGTAATAGTAGTAETAAPRREY